MTSQDPRFNPDGSELRKLQMRTLDILVEVDRICRRHGLRYWLSSGTMLGAVRHGGFIPWDDDLDIEMPRKDYLRLLDILHKELPDHLRLQTPDTDPGYFYTYAKVRDTRSRLLEPNHYDRIFGLQGIYIDIFPIERMRLPLHWISLRTHGRCYKVLKNPRNSDDDCRRKVRRLMWLNTRIVFPVLRFLARLCPVEYHHALGTPYPAERKREDMYPLGEIEFEGHRFLCPRDYDAYLRRIYGDYMQLPPMDSIRPHVEKVEFY